MRPERLVYTEKKGPMPSEYGPLPRAVIPARDGTRALAIVEFQGRGRHHADEAFAYYVQTDPQGEQTRVLVSLDPIFLHQLDRMGRPDQSEEDVLQEIAYVTLAEHLDQGGDIPLVRSGQPALVLPGDQVAQAYFEQSRQRARDADIFAYIGTKLYWGWRYGLTRIELDGADARRLGVPIRELSRVALSGDAVYWNRAAPDTLQMAPTPKLLADLPSGAFPGVERPLLDRVGDRLAAPRYEAARDHFERAHAYYSATPADFPNAVKEATAAVESVALRVLGRTSGTLGDCIKDLRGRGLLVPPLDKTFESLWGYASEKPGVRHGKTVKADVPVAEAHLMLNVASAALLFLLELDK